MKAIVFFLVAAPAFGQSADALREEVSYLASPLLQGRATPSPGLDLAAKFIADRFARAPLAQSGDTGFLQGANQKKGPWNVYGILPGSDPTLQREWVILSAHYDHMGRGFPGANDDASGTASLIEIATELASRKERPKRGILFIAFYGEEEGLHGSSYYVRHPLVPLKDTVAEINLEQLGRTDDDAGPKVGSFAMTGSSYSSLPEIVGPVVETQGVHLYHRPDEDSYFNRSDNFPFAKHGVVDTTFVVAFEFPDYHKKTDTADKIDYGNLALLDRGIAAVVWRLANSAERPVWKKPIPSDGH